MIPSSSSAGRRVYSFRFAGRAWPRAVDVPVPYPYARAYASSSKYNTETLDGGSLGSSVDEERGYPRELMRIAGLSEHRHLERTLRPRDPIVPGPRPVERRSRHVNAVRRRRWRRRGAGSRRKRSRARPIRTNARNFGFARKGRRRRASLRSSVSRNARPFIFAQRCCGVAVFSFGRRRSAFALWESESSTSVRAVRLRSR